MSTVFVGAHTEDGLSKAERIEALRHPFWIGYARALETRARLEHLLTAPKQHRMPGLSLIGETNNGKTTILKRFVEDHTPIPDPNEDRTHLPVVMLQTPPAPDEGRLYDVLLHRFHATGPLREGTDIKLRRLELILKALGTRVLILDEFSNALAGSTPQLKRFINAIRYVLNELQICIVVSGVPSALSAISSDPQLSNRLAPAFLPVWTANPAAYASLLLSYEQVLGLKNVSRFRSKAVVQVLLHLTGGLIGETDQLLRLLAARAIETGSEMIGEADLTPEVMKSIHWVEPQSRTRYDTR